MRRRGCLPFSVSALCTSLLCVYLLLVCFVQANMFQVFDKGVSCPRHCCHTQHWGNNALDKDVSPDFYAFRNSVAQILCLYTLEIAVYWWYFRFVVVIWAINSCNAWLWQQDRKKTIYINNQTNMRKCFTMKFKMLNDQVAGHTVKCSWGKESGDPNNLPTNAQVPSTCSAKNVRY